jgi:hypothetical protein
MQNEPSLSEVTQRFGTPEYETPKQHRDEPPPAPEEGKLGSMRLGIDPTDAVANDPVGVPTEYVAADVRPVAVLPVEGIPPEVTGGEFLTPETRPRESRPREFVPREAL